MLRCLLCLLLCLQVSLARAEEKPGFTWTVPLHQAYTLSLQLRLKEAELLLKTQQAQAPRQALIPYLQNYLDFFRLFISEDRKTFDLCTPLFERRLASLKEADPSSPYWRFTQAELQLQWALLHLKFEENFSALRLVRKAYVLLEENERLHPGFMPNQKSLGIIQALLGTIPGQYQWGIRLLGMEGSISQGKAQLEHVMRYCKKESGFIYREESAVMYAFLQLYLQNDDAEAWKILSQAGLKPAESPLATFALAHVAMHTGQNDKAIELLQDRPQGPQYYPFYYLDFLLGLAKARRLDADAGKYLQHYVRYFKGINYRKEACQKLAWLAWIRRDASAYTYWQNQVKTQGGAVVDEDKSALRESAKPGFPPAALLEARLLFDGGYYQRSRSILQKSAGALRSQPQAFLEWNYRMGRVEHRLDQAASALQYYRKTIELGAAQTAYFACSAALYCGQLSEERGDRKMARYYYEYCLGLSPDQYKTSLHQKAKAGLNRLQ